MTEDQRLKHNERNRTYRANLSPEQKAHQRDYKVNWSKSPSRIEIERKRLREYARLKRSTPEGAVKAKEALRRYLDKNRDTVNARNRERGKNLTPEQRQKKRDANRRYRSRWSDERKNQDRERTLKSRRENPDRHNANNQRRRCIKKGNGGSYTAKEWRELKDTYGHRCLACGRCEPEIKLTVDHVVPVTKGGRNDISNIQPLCYSCNASKQDRITDYRSTITES